MAGTIPTLNGRYRFDRPIGTGGMATVYLGWDELLRRHVAVKMLSPTYATDRAFVERFRREARAMANLMHPNIVAVYDWAEHDNTYCMVMEYVEGRTLRHLLRERGQLTEAAVLDIGTQIAAALAVAHEHQVIHRDIKPQNILISPDGRVKVTDFGIARIAGTSTLTTPHAIMGTVQYLAPEQVLRQEVDARSDLYSLGVVMYELLTGAPPFDSGATIATIAMQHVHAAPKPLRTRRPEISARTEAIIAKALAKEPAARYQDATTFQAALEQAAEALANPADMTAPLARSASRPPASRVPLHALHHALARLSPRPFWLAVLPLLLCLALLTRAGAAIGSSLVDLSVPRVASASISAATSATGTLPMAGRVSIPETTTFVSMSGVRSMPVDAVLTRLQAPLPSPTLPPPTATATPTVAPTAIPTLPPPTLTPSPPTALPPTSTPAPRIIVQAPRPQEAVLAFYQLVASHRFDVAAALWSPQMQAQNPPAQAINARYSQTERIIVQHWEVTDQTADNATIAFIISEYVQGSSTPHNFQGVWHLVHTDIGWLLDSEDIQPA